jgi:NAD/NADP transhydrogenase alpha subunit
MKHTIFLAKETRSGERRVALIPTDVKQLIVNGHDVVVESNAGSEAGYSNTDYQAIGASIIDITQDALESYQSAFKSIDCIVRAKRPHRRRELLESQAIQTGTIMIGALDPLEPHSNHINEYHNAGIIAYSIDQLALPSNDPMNVLAAMSRLAGTLALQDAISQGTNPINKVVIIGFGEVGKAALAESLKQQLETTVLVGNEKAKSVIQQEGANAHIIDRSLSLEKQQAHILQHVSNADIVITSARKPGGKAPLLIPESSLNKMRPGAVIVDMAISEGGNVFGSEHDKTITTENNVMITNVSGYPKVMPKEASALWSRASLHFILAFSKNPESINLNPC